MTELTNDKTGSEILKYSLRVHLNRPDVDSVKWNRSAKASATGKMRTCGCWCES